MPVPPFELDPIFLYGGDEPSIPITMTDEDDEPLDLSNVSAWAADVVCAGRVVTSLSLGTEQLADGVVSIDVRASDARAILAASVLGLPIRFDMQAQQGGRPRTFLTGSFTAADDITRGAAHVGD